MDFTKINKTLVKINRFSGWALFFLIGLFIISGFGMTKAVIDPVFAKLLHEKWLPLPLFVFFVLHSAINIKFFLMRKKITSERWLNTYILILGLLIFGLCLYLYFI